MHYTYEGARHEVDKSKKYCKKLRINNLCESISIPIEIKKMTRKMKKMMERMEVQT